MHMFLPSLLYNTSQLEYPENSIFAKIAFKDLKKDICWFWKTDTNRRKTQEEFES